MAVKRRDHQAFMDEESAAELMDALPLKAAAVCSHSRGIASWPRIAAASFALALFDSHC